MINFRYSHGLGLPNDEVVEISVTMRVIGDVAEIVERLPQVAAKIVKPDSTLYIVSQTGAVRCDANLDEKFSVTLKVSFRIFSVKMLNSTSDFLFP